jgi:hypothetical protein
MDTPWKPLRKRWDRGIDTSTATEEDLDDYVEAKAIIYEREQLCDTVLWEVFKIDFRSFTLEVLNRVNSIALYRLRSCLQRGGVFIAPTTQTEGSDVRKTIVSTMKDTIKEGIKHKWTEEDVESVRETLEGTEPVFSRVLARGGLLKNLDVCYATNCANISSLTLSTSRVNIPSVSNPDNPPNRPQNLPTPTPEPQSYPLLNSLPPTIVADIQPQPQPQPVLRPVDIAKQISEIARIITEEQKLPEEALDKIVTACQGSPAYRYTVSDPPSYLGALLYKLQSSITTYKKEQSLGATETFFTDRRYYRRSDQRFRSGQQSQQSRFNPQRSHNRPNRCQGVCFICRKEGCRLWKHLNLLLSTTLPGTLRRLLSSNLPVLYDSNKVNLVVQE